MPVGEVSSASCSGQQKVGSVGINFREDKSGALVVWSLIPQGNVRLETKIEGHANHLQNQMSACVVLIVCTRREELMEATDRRNFLQQNPLFYDNPVS
jgi:hypothetical protein